MEKESQQNNKFSILYQIMDDAAIIMHENLYKTIGSSALSYLEKRKISEASIKTFRIGFCENKTDGLSKKLLEKYSLEQLKTVGLVYISDKTNKPIDRFYNRIIFPICNAKGQVIAFGGRTLLNDIQPKYLNSSDTPLFSKSHVLFGLNHAKNNVTAKNSYIVVEGYLDVIALYQKGIKNTVAPLGTAITAEHFEILWKHQLAPTLCFDGDAAGYNAAIRAAQKALPLIDSKKNINFALLPKGEDPDSLAQKDIALLKNIIEQPIPLSVLLWKELTENKKFETPEKQIHLQTKIQDIIKEIKNIEIRELYKVFFKKEFFKLTNMDVKKNYRKINTPSPPNPNENKKNLIILQQILLATLVHNPYLINEVMDNLLQVEFDEQFANIFDFLIHYDGILEKSALLSKLGEIYPMEKLEIFGDNFFYLKAPFIYKGEKEKLLSGWLDICEQVYMLKGLDLEMSDAKKNLNHTFDNDSWQRIKRLTELKLKERPDYE